jgi:hypothetical protein
VTAVKEIQEPTHCFASVKRQPKRENAEEKEEAKKEGIL